jgi:undecaprenyl-diphosphatase
VAIRLLDSLMIALSAAGGASLVWLVVGLAGACVHRARAAGVWQMAVALVLVSAIGNSIIKPLVHRPRPPATARSAALVADRPSTYSFPSGHAASSFAAAYALSRAWPSASIPLWLLAALVGFSRWYLGLHYPSDIVGGALLGLAVAWFVVGRTAWYSGRPAEQRPSVPR